MRKQRAWKTKCIQNEIATTNSSSCLVKYIVTIFDMSWPDGMTNFGCTTDDYYNKRGCNENVCWTFPRVTNFLKSEQIR